jgi:glycosyltransferase involved in cell wall biosynthesis
MRIGIIAGEYPPMQGGVGAYTAVLARHLAATGHEIHLFSTQDARSDEFPLTNTLIRWDYHSLSAIRAWSQETKLDILNLQFQTAAFGMSPFIHFLPDFVRDIPLVTTFHDLRFPYLFPKAGPLRDWIVMHLAKTSAGVIVTNHEDAARIDKLPCWRLIPIGSNILRELPSIFDTAAWRKRAGASEGDLLLAFFGLINRSKGLDTLLTSLAELRQNGIPVRLVIVGGVAGTSDATNTAYITEMERQISQLGLQDDVYRTGFLDDEIAVGSYLRASDAVVLPFTDGASFRRGSLMAAIHYFCPIITTVPNMQIPEFVDGENMLFVPPSDSYALTQAITRLHTNPALASKLRQGASQLAQHFNWSQIADDYTEFFQRVLGASA